MTFLLACFNALKLLRLYLKIEIDLIFYCNLIFVYFCIFQIIIRNYSRTAYKKVNNELFLKERYRTDKKIMNYFKYLQSVICKKYIEIYTINIRMFNV